jgi:hypothetical protein
MSAPCTTDFDDWLVQTFAKTGSYTMLIILVEIGETTVSLLASSYLHVIGDETRWADMQALLAASGVNWTGAVFFQADRGGLIDDTTAQQRLNELSRHIQGDRSILRHGEFFNPQGLRMQIAETGMH